MALGQEYRDYMDAVFDYLEYIEYPYWVQHYKTEQVATSIFKATVNFFHSGISVRMAAIVIFSLTMENQVLRPIDPSTERVH